MDSYPRYKKGDLENLYWSLSQKDKKTLDDFATACATSANKNKVKDMTRSLLQFRNITNTSFDAITLKHLHHFLVLLNQSDREEWGKHDIKLHVKRFLKWNYKDWNERFNEFRELKIGTPKLNEEKINDKTLLKKGDIETIMNKEHDLVLKTFFITLYESGMRPSELRTAMWKDVSFDSNDDVTEINVFMTKNKEHKSVYIQKATFYLKKLQEISQGEYIFPSRENKELPITDATAHRWVQQLGKHIDKKIYPYLLRHTRSQELYTLVDQGKLSSNVVQKFLGHKKDMLAFYLQTNKATVKEEIKRNVYHFNELPPEKKADFEKRIKALEHLLHKATLEKAIGLHNQIEMQVKHLELLRDIAPKNKKKEIDAKINAILSQLNKQ